jgi:hypothetical protein
MKYEAPLHKFYPYNNNTWLVFTHKREEVTTIQNINALDSRGPLITTPASYSKKSRVQISARSPDILTTVFRCFRQSFQANTGIVL